LATRSDFAGDELGDEEEPAAEGALDEGADCDEGCDADAGCEGGTDFSEAGSGAAAGLAQTLTASVI